MSLNLGKAPYMSYSEGYIAGLYRVQGLESKLLKGVYIGDYI